MVHILRCMVVLALLGCQTQPDEPWHRQVQEQQTNLPQDTDDSQRGVNRHQGNVVEPSEAP